MEARVAAASSKTVIGVAVRDPGWFSVVRRPVKPGALANPPLRIPQADAQRLLRGIIRFVADIPAGASLGLVWQQGNSELFVDAGTVTLTCTTGLVTIGVTVHCDELPAPAVANVALAVGQPDSPSGLVMSSFERVDAPDLIADLWSEALTAFAWEALLEFASRLCAGVGKDSQGRALIPGSVAAAPELFVITPMARNDLSRIGG
jgi:hypothetical protein